MNLWMQLVTSTKNIEFICISSTLQHCFKFARNCCGYKKAQLEVSAK